ncbi:MAG: hypothetical protein JXB46_08685, partial [Candidatus Eisenbacteria bacterium]|nr:hypothetical protein [Candidatus Eisenbacteria bacterium]
EKARSLADREFDVFVEHMVELYLTFVYEVIEKGRRRALAEMIATAKAPDSQEFRQRLLRYLEATEYSDRLEGLLDDSRGGVDQAVPMLVDLLTPNEAAEVRGQVARYLETYPDHPGLLYLRSLTEALSKDTDLETVYDNYEAWLRSATENYTVGEDTLLKAAAYALKRLAPRYPGLAKRVERLTAERFSSTDQLRVLAEKSGLESLQVIPWILLTRHVDRVGEVLGYRGQEHDWGG